MQDEIPVLVSDCLVACICASIISHCMILACYMVELLSLLPSGVRARVTHSNVYD